MLVERCGRLGKVSPTYASSALGYESSHEFYNRSLSVYSGIQAPEIMKLALEIERELGRKRHWTGYEDRLIDIDMLFYGSAVLRSKELCVPHPRMEERRFVLQATADIYPTFLHPVLNLTVKELLEKCKDSSRLTPV